MKVSQKEWEELVKKRLAEKRLRQVQEKRVFQTDQVLETLRRHITIPIWIGLISALLMYAFFGKELLFQKILEWTIAGTLFATMLAWLSRERKKTMYN